MGHRDDRFSCSAREPDPQSSIRGHAAFEPDAAQAGLQDSACTRPGLDFGRYDHQPRF